MTPLCPLLMQARAALALRELTADWFVMPAGHEVEGAGVVQREPLFPDPSSAPGVACIGSRCAWWAGQPGTVGRCGGAVGGSFTDPAGNQP